MVFKALCTYFPTIVEKAKEMIPLPCGCNASQNGQQEIQNRENHSTSCYPVSKIGGG